MKMKKNQNSYIYRILKSVIDRGLLKTCRLIWQERVIPRIHGLDVTGVVFPEDFGIHNGNKSGAFRYEAINSAVFERTMLRLNIDFNNYNFIDLGCGKGFALFLAHKSGFKHVIGVEFVKKLADTCQKNLCGKLNPDSFKVLNLDATKFTPTTTKNVFFLNNPFSGKIITEVFTKLMSNSEFDREHDFIIYNNAIYKEALLNLGFKMVDFEEGDPLKLYTGGTAVFRLPPNKEV